MKTQHHGLQSNQVPLIYQAYMAQAIELAKQGWGTTTPNPMVGAVLLDREGQWVASGYHHAPGQPHAEAMAIQKAFELGGKTYRRSEGGTLIVNLEPCNHHGRTPPCSEAILEAGIAHVIIGALDPNPHVKGGGLQVLQQAGVQCDFGVMYPECLRLNEIFFHHSVTRQPFVTLKLGLTLDGRIATRGGQSQWITGETSRQYVHYLRSGYDAILTTAETVIADNPQLTVRYPGVVRQPIRIVLDRQFRLDLRRYTLFNQTDQAPVWVIGAKAHLEKHYESVAEALGVKVVAVQGGAHGLDLQAILQQLGEAGISSLWVEAGGKLAGSLISKKLVNKYYLFYGSKIMNDPLAKTGFSGPLCLGLSQAPVVHVHQVHTLHHDTLIEAYPATM
jgi:diaminohydroxyphosphoribosylaminopyrimidine deaminase/5-amino-6-(5-phosphoribosylamino)uracil reductase